MKVWPNLENILSRLVMSFLAWIIFYTLAHEKKWHTHCLAWKGNWVELEVNLDPWWVILEDTVLNWKCDHLGWLGHCCALGCGSWLLLLGGWTLPGKSLLWDHTHPYGWTSAASIFVINPQPFTSVATYQFTKQLVNSTCSPQVQSTFLLLLSAGVHPYFHLPPLHIYISFCFPLPSLSVSKENLSFCPGRAHLPSALMMTKMTAIMVVMVMAIL